MYIFALVIFIFSLSIDLLGLLFLFLNIYWKHYYIHKYVMKYYAEKQIKVRDSYIKKYIKFYLMCFLLYSLALPIVLVGNTLGIIIKISTENEWLMFAPFTPIFLFYLIFKSLFSIHKLRKWKKINGNLPNERYLENQIDLNNTEKQIELNSFDNKIWYWFVDKWTNTKFYNKYPSNLNKLSFSKQQEIIYQNAILDFDNTLNYVGEKVSINMFRDIFIKYKII